MNKPSIGAAPPKPMTLGGIGLGAWVFCATLVGYLPSLSGEFIWNDSDYVTAPGLRSLAGLGRIWGDIGATQQYYPLLHTAFWVQHLIFADRPLGYHGVTLGLHAASALLFAVVLRRLLDGRKAGEHPYPGAEWLAALLFALHPAHVESVAWITEQKNTLSLLFYLSGALAYLHFDQARGKGAYGLALALFALSLLCKTVTATLPAALLVAFWWERGRIDWRRDVLPLLPWFALGAAAGLFTSWVEKTYVGAQGADFNLPMLGRLLVAGRAVWFYAATLAWPFSLNFVYPRWTVDTASLRQWLWPVGVLALGAALWALRRRTRGPLAAYLFFVGSLFPALGIVNLYGARYSWVWDHWQYLPDLGPLALTGVGLSAVWHQAAPRPRWLGPALAAALALFLGVLTWSHCVMFHDNQTLYRMTLERNPGSWMAHNNLGKILIDEGSPEEGVSQVREALRLKPDYAEAHSNLGVYLMHAGLRGEGMAEFRAALAAQPLLPNARANLGLALMDTPGHLDEGIELLRAALRNRGDDPDMAEFHDRLGTALEKIPGGLPEAVSELETAVRLEPGSVSARGNLGVALARAGHSQEAIDEFEEALRISPENPRIHNDLGIVLDSQGRLDQAMAQFRDALRLSPGNREAHYNLGLTLQKAGRLEEASVEFSASGHPGP